MAAPKLWQTLAMVTLAGVISVCLTAPSSATITPVKFENGMEVIFWENHSSPMIASVVFVRAGAKYETDYNNGVTHLLEHLLFDGTKNRTRQEITDGVDGHGGYINAFTRRDLTGYLVLMPKEFISVGLEIQADQLFNSIFPDEELPKERKVVIEEMQKENDNEESVAGDLFYSKSMAGSGYERPVLGYKNIIASIPKEEIIRYWKQFYAPNNMMALVIGDFDTERMIQVYRDAFGVIPPVTLPAPPQITYTAPTTKSISRHEGATKLTYLNFGIDAPRFSDPDYFAFDLLSDYLGSDEISPFKKVLIDSAGKPLYQSFSVSLETMSEFSRLLIDVVAADPANAGPIRAGVEEVLSNLASYQPSAEVIQGLKVSKKAGQIFMAEKLHYYGFTIAPIMVTAGWDFMANYLADIDDVTPAQMLKAAQRRFKDLKYTAVIYTPKPADAAAESEKSNTVFRKEVLANGLTIVVKANPDSRVFAMNVIGKNRTASEPDGKTGITDFVNRMIKKGTKTLPAEALANRLASIGAEATLFDNPWIPYDDMYTSRAFSFMKFETIDEFTKEGLALFADMIQNPSFDSAAVEEVRGQIMGLLGRESGSTLNSCRDLFYATLFEGQAYAKTIDGTPRTIGSISREDLINYHRSFYSPGNMIVTVGTNYDADTVMALIKKSFGGMTAVPLTIAPAKPGQSVAGFKTAHKEMQKEQVYIFIGNLLPAASDPDAPALVLAAEILSERMQKHLREEQGLAYSVGAGATLDRDFGWFSCSMGTGAANLGKARDGMLAEIKNFTSEGPTADEVETSRNSLWGTSLTRRLSRINQAYYMGVDEYRGLGYDYDKSYITNLRALTAADVKAAAAKYFNADNCVIATVGKGQ